MAAAGRPQPGRPSARPAANRTKNVPAAPPAPVDTRDAGRAVDWLNLLLICAIAVLCALFELMLIPVYIGSVIVPISVVLALASNIVLPWWGYRTLDRATGAVLPVVVWLIVLLGLSVVTRPEGDLFVTSAYNQSWVYYGVILLGAVAGFTTLLRLTAPKPTPDNGRRQPSG